MTEQLKWGNMPVPYTVLWTAEAGQTYVGKCEFTGMQATCEPTNRGVGKPIFAKPHANRQRETIFKDWCDLCGKPLKGRTKVSLSKARTVFTDTGAVVLQVEPMVHKDCALTCVELCPSLKRDVKNGTLFVRQVLKHRAQMALLTSAAVMEFCGVEKKGDVIGHLKVELLKWKDRDLQWLMA